MKIITKYSEINREDWCEFITQHSYGNIFQTKEMFDVYKNTNNYEPLIFALTKENQIKGIMLAVIQKEHNGFWGQFSSRAIVIGGPLVENNNLEFLDYILKYFKEIIKGEAIYTQFRNIWKWSNQEILIFEKYGFQFEDHLDIIHDLNSIENIWNNLKPNAKNKIRKSLKNNLIFREINEFDEIDVIYLLLKNVYNKANIPLAGIELFKNAFEILSVNNMIKIFVACKDETIIGVRIVFTFKHQIYDWYAASDFKHYNLSPNDFLPWKILEWGIENGYKKFDFGGAGKPDKDYGVREYKLKFGGNLVNFGRFQKVHNKFLFQLGKMGLKIYKIIKIL